MSTRFLNNKIVFQSSFWALFLAPVGLLFFFFAPPSLPPTALTQLSFSILLATLGTAGAVILALPVVFVASGQGFLARVLCALALIPFFLPVNIVSTLMLQAYQTLFRWTGLEGRGHLVGLVFAHALYEAPLVVFYLAHAIRTIPSVYFDMMQMDGLPRIKAYSLTLSMIAPQIKQALALVFLYIFQSTALMLSLGLGKYHTLESSILVNVHQHSLQHALGLGLLQTVVLVLFLKTSTGQSPSFYYSLTRETQSHALSTGLLSRLWAFAFLGLFIFLFAPLVLYSWQGIPQLKQVWAQFAIGKSLVTSIFVSCIASFCALVFTLIWQSLSSGKTLCLPLSISHALYFTGLLLCGILANLSPICLAIWGLAFVLIPLMSWFLQSGQANEDKDIVQAAKLDGANGWILWFTILWPMGRERYILAFFQGVILAFGNFSMAYLLTQQHVILAPAVLDQLVSRHYIGAANALSALIFLLMFLPLCLVGKQKINST